MGEKLSNVGYLENQDVDTKGNLINPKIPKNKPVVVMVMAGWCPHCVSMKPIYQEFANQYRDKVFCTVIQQDGDRQSEKDLAARIKTFYPEFRGYPTFFLYKNGKRINKSLQDRSLQGMVEFALGQ